MRIRRCQATPERPKLCEFDRATAVADQCGSHGDVTFAGRIAHGKRDKQTFLMCGWLAPRIMLPARRMSYGFIINSVGPALSATVLVASAVWLALRLWWGSSPPPAWALVLGMICAAASQVLYPIVVFGRAFRLESLHNVFAGASALCFAVGLVGSLIWVGWRDAR